jgi:hypothetical protein
MVEHKEEFPIVGDVILEFSVNFNKDLYNWYSGQPKKKGYHAHFSRITVTKDANGNRTGHMFTAGDGFYVCVLECERRNKKKLKEAIDIARAKYLNQALQHFKDKEEAKLVNQKINSTEG